MATLRGVIMVIYHLQKLFFYILIILLRPVYLYSMSTLNFLYEHKTRLLFLNIKNRLKNAQSMA